MSMNSSMVIEDQNENKSIKSIDSITKISNKINNLVIKTKN